MADCSVIATVRWDAVTSMLNLTKVKQNSFIQDKNEILQKLRTKAELESQCGQLETIERQVLPVQFHDARHRNKHRTIPPSRCQKRRRMTPFVPAMSRRRKGSTTVTTATDCLQNEPNWCVLMYRYGLIWIPTGLSY
ncbi:hypothetical protein HPP92_018246 [Vanilla planifolia]|uniref:Uncharacterized protein n=1 Tax=Vanilla planifolia TaxID=51239 RepID=A0A835Q9J2_VANPL|nr:hypothetical protein HPP92_018246 [Vanilla planifolia]